MKVSALRNPALPIAGIILATVLIGMMALSWRVLELSESSLQPELELQSVAVGLSVRDVVERALSYDIPLDALNGMGPFLDEFRVDGGLAYVAISQDGSMLFSAGQEALRALEGTAGGRVDPVTGAEIRVVTGHLDTMLPLHSNGVVVGQLHIGMADAIFVEVLRNNALDILTVFLLSLLLAVELTMLVLAYSVTGPLSELRAVLDRVAHGSFVQACRVAGTREVRRVQDGLNQMIGGLNARASDVKPRKFDFALGGSAEIWREPRLAGIRLLAFLFVMAEEVARPFLPLFLGERSTGAPAGLSGDLVAGTIMTASMIVLALSMPISGTIVGRIGPRKLFVLGALTAAVSLGLTGFAYGFWAVLGLRALSAVGYAMCYIACQSYVVQATGDRNRASGVGLFVGGIMMADLFGAAMGGILAERVGATATFMVAAGLATTGALLVWSLMEPLRAPKGEVLTNRVTVPALLALIGNRRFLTVALLAAVPTKLVMVGVLYYLVPIYLTSLDMTQGDVGRVIMAYGFFAVVALPFAGGFADQRLGHRWAVIIGSFVAAPLLLLVPVYDGFVVMLIAVGAMGLGQALTTTSTIPLVMELCRSEIAVLGQGPVLGTLRLVERFGAAFAPLLGAVLAAQFGFTVAIAALGALALICALLLGLLTRGLSGGDA